MSSLRLPLALVFLIAPLFAASNGIPSVNQPLFPSTVGLGRTDFTLRVDGSGFVPGAVVNWNGMQLATRFINRSQVRATVPAANVANPGTFTVTVTNPTPGGGASNPLFFTVTKRTPSLTFAPSSSVTVGASISAVAVGDFDNDGKQDVAVLNQGADYTCTGGTVGSEYVSTFLGNGDGTFTKTGALQVACPTLDGGSDFAITVADFNGDGWADLAVSFTGYVNLEFGHYVAIYLGHAGGKFSDQPSTVQGSVGDEGGMPIAGDFNSDGNMDAAIEGSNIGFLLFVLTGKGDGTLSFGPITSLNRDLDSSGGWLVAGDFNNDGILDMVSPPATDTPTILLGNGDGTFTPAPSQPAATYPNAPVVADFNGDGILDLIFTSSGSLAVLLGNGDGTFTQNSEQSNGNGTPLAADLNGDGKLDLVVVDSANSILIYPGNGDGTFQTALDIGYSGPQLAVADFNGDGRLDLLTLSSTNTFTLLLQAPDAMALPSSHNFGKVPVGTTSKTQHVTLNNAGSAVLQLSGIIASGDFAQTNDCSTTLSFGKTCSIEVVFKPTATGLRTGTVTITDNAAESPQIVQLSGTGN
jgi:hypothetical protein